MERRNILPTLIIITLTFNIIIGASFAYFMGSVDGNTNLGSVSVTTRNVSVNYIESNTLNLTGMLPGAVFIKNFTITNTGTSATSYSVDLVDVVNELSRNSDLVYTISGTNGGANLAQATYPSTNTTIISNIAIAPETTHEYTLTIYYINQDLDQSIDMNKTVTGTIQVN